MIWLIGNMGMLGADIETELRNSEIEYISSDKEVDITDISSLRNFVKDKEITYIVNCAAYTAVDKAEDEKDLAFLLNGSGVLNIAIIAKEKDATLIHFSTDYVFNGKNKDGYIEDDKVDPQSVYGASKLEGETNILQTLKKYYIFRISWLYGEFGPNFVKTMLRLFSERDELSIVADQYGSPTNTIEISKVIKNIIIDNLENYGIYHYSNLGRITWFDFASKIYEIAKSENIIQSNVKLIPVTTDKYPTKAIRPKESYMLKDKFIQTFGNNIDMWDVTLENYLKKEGK